MLRLSGAKLLRERLEQKQSVKNKDSVTSLRRFDNRGAFEEPEIHTYIYKNVNKIDERRLVNKLPL